MAAHSRHIFFLGVSASTPKRSVCVHARAAFNKNETMPPFLHGCVTASTTHEQAFLVVVGVMNVTMLALIVLLVCKLCGWPLRRWCCSNYGSGGRVTAVGLRRRAREQQQTVRLPIQAEWGGSPSRPQPPQPQQQQLVRWTPSQRLCVSPIAPAAT